MSNYPHLPLFCQHFQEWRFGVVFFNWVISFSRNKPRSSVHGKRGNCAQLEVRNRLVMPTVNVLKRQCTHFTAILWQKKV